MERASSVSARAYAPYGTFGLVRVGIRTAIGEGGPPGIIKR